MIDALQNLRVLSRIFLHRRLRVIDNCCELLELRVFVFIFLSNDNGTRSASFSSS